MDFRMRMKNGGPLTRVSSLRHLMHHPGWPTRNRAECAFASMRTHIRYRPWRHTENPKRILAIRLQAMGDMVITLPYLESLKSRLPQADLDFLTRREVDDIPRNLDLFGHVFSIGGERNFKKQVLSTVSLLPQLWVRHYDVVIDLQDNPISQWVRKLLRPRSWSSLIVSPPSLQGNGRD